MKGLIYINFNQRETYIEDAANTGRKKIFYFVCILPIVSCDLNHSAVSMHWWTNQVTGSILHAVAFLVHNSLYDISAPRSQRKTSTVGKTRQSFWSQSIKSSEHKGDVIVHLFILDWCQDNLFKTLWTVIWKCVYLSNVRGSHIVGDLWFYVIHVQISFRVGSKTVIAIIQDIPYYV